MVIAFHIGTDPVDLAAGEDVGVIYRGPGGALLNYTETTFSGQRAVMKMVAGGALDRHAGLKVLVSEGGATWVPFLVDRMEEGYRQHNKVIRPKLVRPLREIVYSQVYASFQHDATAVAAVESMGYRNVMWGSDYPHMEGTYGHTQETLHGLFDKAEPEVRKRVTLGAFMDLFPEVGEPPAADAVVMERA
jgi:predicted TIM-barrel fold metal-dependent hydrolase